jgi:hypothetical protein
MPSFGRQVKPFAPMSQICGMSKNPITYCGSRKLYDKLFGHFSLDLTEVSGVACHRAPLEMKDGTKWRNTKSLLVQGLGAHGVVGL